MDVWIEKRKKEREGEKVRDVHNVDLGKNKHINKQTDIEVRDRQRREREDRDRGKRE